MPLPVRRAAAAAAPHVACVRAAALAPGTSHSGACVAVCLQPTTTTPTPHCPNTQFLTPGRRGTTTAAAAAGGGGCPWAGSLLSSLPLSLPLWGVVACCRVDCVDAPCVGASPFPPTPSGVGLSCAASLVLRPPFTRVGREAACAVNNPHAALRWGHTQNCWQRACAAGGCALCVSAPPPHCARGNRSVTWKARCLCHLPPGPSLPPCPPRSPSPCPVASCLTRWRCP